MDDKPRTIKVRIRVSTDKVGSTVHKDVEVDAEDWNDMGPLERNEFAMDYLWDLIEWGLEVIDDEPIPVTRGSDNVFADLGLPDADRLLEESRVEAERVRDAAERAAKADLAKSMLADARKARKRNRK